MRKIISKIAGLMLGLSLAAGVGVSISATRNDANLVYAGDVTFTPSNCGWSTTGGAQSGTISGVTVSTSNGAYNTSNNDFRVYKNAALTVSSSVGDITALAFTYSGSNNGGWSTSYTPNAASWTSSAATGTQARITNLVVTVQESGKTFYTVSFNMQGHGTAPSEQSIEDGNKVAEPADPVAGGWIFGGWFKEDSCDTPWNFSVDTVTEATVIYAKWTEDATATRYELIEEEQADWSGTYLIANVNGNTANVWTGVDEAGCSEATEISNKKIIQTENAQTVTITSATGGYAISVNGGTNSGKYVYAPTAASGGNMAFSTTAEVHEISYSDSAVNLAINSRTLRYNAGRFRYYLSGQSPIQLFKEVSNNPVDHLSISGSMTKTSYYQNESWDPTGFTVYAYYQNDLSTPVNVTSSVIWSYNPNTTASVETTSVIATAAFGGKSISSTSQSVSVSKMNPIQALYTQASGASVDVYGYYVGFLDGTGPVIMDGVYGIVIYDKTADVSGYTVSETILHVTGSISIYKGLYEIGSATVSIASGTFDAPNEPVVYTTNGSETAEYASRLTTVTGTPSLVSGSFDSDAGTSDITLSFNVSGSTVQVFYKSAAQTADSEAFTAIKTAVNSGTEITIKGFTGWYNGFQVQMNGYVPAVETYTAEDFSQDLLDQTDAVCEGYKDGDNNHDALVAIWSNLASNDKYPSLPTAQKTILAEAERNESGTVVEQAMARYDYLTGKYNLNNFINGRTPVVVAGAQLISANNINNSSSTIVIVVVALTSITSIGVLLVIKRKRSLVK